MITWAQRVQNLRKALGRDPALEELLLIAPLHEMTEDELREQQASFVRGMKRTGDPRFD